MRGSAAAPIAVVVGLLLVVSLLSGAVTVHSFGDPLGVRAAERATCRANASSVTVVHVPLPGPSLKARRHAYLALEISPATWPDCDVGRAVYLMGKAVPGFHLARLSCAGAKPMPFGLRSAPAIAGELHAAAAKNGPPTVRLCGLHRAQLGALGALVANGPNGAARP